MKSVFFTGGIGFLIIVVMIGQFFPVILDFIFPLAEPRLFKSFITVEYFISQDNYIYTIILHEFIIILLCVSTLTATGTQVLLLSHHTFGMFKIAW